jgi:hypothetical protein
MYKLAVSTHVKYTSRVVLALRTPERKQHPSKIREHCRFEETKQIIWWRSDVHVRINKPCPRIVCYVKGVACQMRLCSGIEIAVP